MEKMGRVEISVIMLTYNREKLVSRAIESISGQTFDSFEFIVVDNGSSDSSGLIADSYAQNDSRIQVIHRERGNIGTGRNTGLDAARGRYIMFIDDDDFAYPDMLDFLHLLITKHNADIAICGSTKEIDGIEQPNFLFDEILEMTASESVIEYLKRKRWNAAMPTKLLKRELFDKIRFFENGNYDDISVGYRYFANAGKVVAQGIPKYCFVRHDANNSKAAMSSDMLNPYQLDEYFAAFRERTRYISELLPDIADWAQYSEWSYMISMCNKISSNNLSDCAEQLAFVKKELSEHYDEFCDCPYTEEFEREFVRKYIERPIPKC